MTNLEYKIIQSVQRRSDSNYATLYRMKYNHVSEVFYFSINKLLAAKGLVIVEEISDWIVKSLDNVQAFDVQFNWEVKETGDIVSEVFVIKLASEVGNE